MALIKVPVLTVFFVFWVNYTHASKPPAKIKNSGQIKKELDSHRRRVSLLKKEIKAFEYRIESSNKKYNKTLKRRQKIEKLLEKQHKDLQQSSLHIEKLLAKIKRVRAAVVVNSLEEGEPAEMASRKALLAKMNKERIILQELRNKGKELEENLSKLQRKYEDHLDIEQSLISLIRDWELSKREKSGEYALQMNKVANLKKTYRAMRSATPTTSVGLRFSDPIDRHFAQIDNRRGKRGITYKFKGHHKVKSSQHGQVVYSGKLSTFGNVVMINHGRDLRSVILGQFVPQVKMGTKVAKGAILGHTYSSKEKKGVGKLYFEVRKNNRAQNTMPLMEK